MGWRTVTEAVLQRAPTFGSNRFSTTSNARNEAMFREATAFAQNIKTLERDYKAIIKSADAHCKNLRCILVSPLPRTYNFANPEDHFRAELVVEDREPKLLAANMDVEAIPRATARIRSRTEEEVLKPLNEWMKIYRQIAVHMKSLEDLRLELDSRHRTVRNLEGKMARSQSARKPQAEILATEELRNHKQEKANSTYTRFMEKEETVYHSLVTLIRDTSVLRDYTHSCLNIFRDGFDDAAKAYDAAPLPQQSSNNLVGGPSYVQPLNKYEAQLTGTERATPRGITGFFDRLRGRSSRPPTSPQPAGPAGGRDATEHPDQYNNLYGQYAAPPQRMPQAYMAPQGQPVRTTNDLPPDVQHTGQAYGQPGGAYLPAVPSQYPQPNAGPGMQPYMPQMSGYAAAPPAGHYNNAGMVAGAPAGRPLAAQPSKYGEDYGTQARYGGVPVGQNDLQQGAMGWNSHGY